MRLVQHETNRGYGAALRSGFAAATCDLVAFTDADCQFDLSELDRFVLLSRCYQIVCGYRIDRKDSPLRCIYSRVYNLLARTLLRTGVRDVDCALKMFHRETLPDLTITTNGFLVNAEMLTRANQLNYSVVEVGVSHRPRTAGTSTVSVAHIPGVLAGLVRHWWNHVQFPGADASDARQLNARSLEAAEARRLRWGQILLLIFAGLLLLSNLGYPLIDRDETRYGEIPREMLATGNWVLPQLNFRPYYDKPALLYWLCASSYSVLGVSPGAARLVPAICGIATLAMTMWFGGRMLGRRTGLFAGVTLLLSVGFLGASRVLLMDGALTCFTTLSLFAAYEAVRHDRLKWTWWTFAAAAAGLGFLTKGPIALVLLGPPIAAFSWLTVGKAPLRVRHWLCLGGVVTAIAAPWIIAVCEQDPRFAYEFFYRHNIQRFAGAFHVKPFWYFIPVALVAGHPWTFMALPYASFLTNPSSETRRLRPPAIGFLLLWSGWCFVFFSVSRCKLPTYIMPAAPALALMIGHYLEHAVFASMSCRGLEFSRRWSPWLATISTCLGGVGFGAFALWEGLERPLAAEFIVAGWLLMTVLATVIWRLWSSPRVQWAACVTATILLSVVVLHREMPRFASAQTMFGVGSPMAARLQSPPPTIATVAHEWAGIPFDLHRNDVRNFDSPVTPDLRDFAAKHDRFLLVVKKQEDINALKQTLPPSALLTEVAERGPARLLMVISAEQE